jgi:serine/threonine-protein kinase HipA
MSRKQQRLAIWMNGIKVGYWEKSKGVDSLQYLPDWSADEQGRPLSCPSFYSREPGLAWKCGT